MARAPSRSNGSRGIPQRDDALACHNHVPPASSFFLSYRRSSAELSPCIRALYKGTLRLLLVRAARATATARLLPVHSASTLEMAHPHALRLPTSGSTGVGRQGGDGASVCVCVCVCACVQVLLHDFPEFLCEHHFSLCDVIPVACVQLRNLVLSAFPRSMRLPDPFTPGLKVRPPRTPHLCPPVHPPPHPPRFARLNCLVPPPAKTSAHPPRTCAACALRANTGGPAAGDHAAAPRAARARAPAGSPPWPRGAARRH